MEQDSILDALKQQFTPETLGQMSASLGTDTTTTSNAIALALPALLGGLSRNASNPEGASALNQALGEHDGGILDNLGGLFGGGRPGAGAGAAGGGIGGAILGHIFGSRRAPVEQGVGKATGMDKQQVAQLLMMLAPIVMGVLGRMKQQKGLGASQLPGALQQSANQMEKEIPGAGSFANILDSNNDGQIADDIARLGSTVLGGFLKR